MSKVRKLLQALAALVRNPRLLNVVLDDQHNWRRKAYRRFGRDCELVTIPFSRLAGDQPRPVFPYAFLEGGSLPTDLALLQSLAGGFPHCRYFEIGTWRGESVACVASVAEHCVTVNLSVQQLLDAGYDKAYAQAHLHYSAGLPNVTHIREDSARLAFDSLKETFDLIFIDGDHHYEAILHDTREVFAHLLHPESIVVWHDYALNPETIRYESLAAILEAVPVNLRRNLYHVSNTKCAIYSPTRLEGSRLSYPHAPGGAFSVTLRWHPEKEDA